MRVIKEICNRGSFGELFPCEFEHEIQRQLRDEHMNQTLTKLAEEYSNKLTNETEPPAAASIIKCQIIRVTSLGSCHHTGANNSIDCKT